ncbi:hypothetical protein MTP99_015512 [Tenebrio molitor]|jgi:hypothetical protein|nr:hypothetical protein MTP99_015512 [Tenebrio molitor]
MSLVYCLLGGLKAANAPKPPINPIAKTRPISCVQRGRAFNRRLTDVILAVEQSCDVSPVCAGAKVIIQNLRETSEKTERTSFGNKIEAGSVGCICIGLDCKLGCLTHKSVVFMEPWASFRSRWAGLELNEFRYLEIYVRSRK